MTPDAPSPETWLEVVKGSEPGLRLPLAGATVTLGRAPGNTHVVKDTAVSRQHAKVFLRDGRWWIADLNSSHGTFVRGAKITLHELAPGDEVTLGTTVLRYRVGGQEPPAGAPADDGGFELEMPGAAAPERRTPIPVVARPTLPPPTTGYRRALTAEGEDPFAEEKRNAQAEPKEAGADASSAKPAAAMPVIEMRGRTAEQFTARTSGQPVAAASSQSSTVHVPPPIHGGRSAKGPFRFLRDELDQRGPLARIAATLFALAAAAGLFWLMLQLFAGTANPPETPADDETPTGPDRPLLPPRH